MRPPGQPLAAFVCPGHPLLDATLDLTLESNRDLLKRGAVLVDDKDFRLTPRVLCVLEHGVQDASVLANGERRTVSRRMLYVELDAAGGARHLHYAPYLDYRPLKDDEPGAAALLARPEGAWIAAGIEQKALSHAIAQVVPGHVEEIRSRRIASVEKTRAAVKERLTREIAHWDHRAAQLKVQEEAGRPGARLNSQEARRRAEDLHARLKRRLDELGREAQISAQPPVLIAGLVVVPIGLIRQMTGRSVAVPAVPVDTMAAVMDVERRLGFDPEDKELERLGYDIESRVTRSPTTPLSRASRNSSGWRRSPVERRRHRRRCSMTTRTSVWRRKSFGGSDMSPRFPIPADVLERFCRQHGIQRLSLFGSILKGTARPDSDVDLLVEFEPGREPGLIGLARMESELSQLLGGRPVDLRTAEDLSRYFRDEVVRSAELQYAR